MERPIDLEMNYPSLPGQGEEFSALLRVAAGELENLSALSPTGGGVEDKEIAAQWLSQEGYPVAPRHVYLGSGGHHATLTALLAGGLAGKTVVAEEFTYSNFKAIAALLNIKLVPCHADALGLKPIALREVCARHQADFGRAPDALYIMATVNNPTGTVLPLDRREDIAAIARATNMLIIEDDAYGFLEEEPLPNFFALAPERSFYIYSFSKPLTPGIKINYMLAPEEFGGAVVRALRLSATNIPVLYTRLLNTFISAGRIEKIIREKQKEGRRRQQIARSLLGDYPVLGHINGWHLWLSLPSGVKATELDERLQERGVRIVPSTGYSTAEKPYEGAIRIALGGEQEMERVVEGIERIKAEIGPG
jgi:DNA-binding transcriptional MocR family regulator